MNQQLFMLHGCSIDKATPGDLDVVYLLFEEAIAYQKKNNFVGWETYDRDFIQADVRNGLLYKITRDGKIVCTFSVCFTDPMIWREREKGDALYLHRVVVNPFARGYSWFENVLHWARANARLQGLRYIRIDTWAANHKIIGYYVAYGFRFVEEYTTPDDATLPTQHRNLAVALLEYTV